jgi:hypothetical protein
MYMCIHKKGRLNQNKKNDREYLHPNFRSKVPHN